MTYRLVKLSKLNILNTKIGMRGNLVEDFVSVIPINTSKSSTNSFPRNGDLSAEESDVRFSIGVRNSHDKSFSLGLTVGYRVFVCDNLSFHGDFTPVTRKHSKHFDVVEVIGGAVDRMQRNFKPLIRQIEVWKDYQLSDAAAKCVIYKAFIEADVLERNFYFC